MCALCFEGLDVYVRGSEFFCMSLSGMGILVGKKLMSILWLLGNGFSIHSSGRNHHYYK